MANGSLRMSDAETLKFLNYYRNEPALWDPTNDGYKKREERVAAAKRIAEVLNLPNFTASHVITKFKNLRSSYAQELKKIAASRRSSISTQDIYVPKVVWFREMDAFLRPHVKSRASQSSLPRSTQESMEINVDDDDNKAEDPQNETQFQQEADVITDSSPQPGTSTEKHRTSTHQAMHLTELQSANSACTVSEGMSKSWRFRNSKTPLKRPAPKERKVQKQQHVENKRPDILMSAIDKLDKISQRATAKKDDSFDHFGRYIASLLRTLPIQQALLLQQEMITRALNVHMSSLNPSAPSPSNYQTQTDHAFSPKSEDSSWISDMSAAMDDYTQND